MKIEKASVFGISFLFFLSAFSLFPLSGGHASNRNTELVGDLVLTTGGLVRGTLDGQAYVFRGIPYAAPPVEEGRWKPPAPLPPWNGIRDATIPAAPCAQAQFNSDGSLQVIGSEDCLTVDVTIPGSATLHSRLPVMVYFHGGGNRNGAPPDDASPFVNQDVIVVGVRSRLGVFGFLGLPELSAEGGGSSANYALFDQIAALRWVQENISNFGGDPKRMMIFGTSSGSFNVTALISSPLARGLFSAAAIETAVNMNVSLDQVEALGTRFAAEVGCGNVPDILACLRSLPPATLLGPLFINSNLFGNLPVIDGKVLPASPQELLQVNGSVPLLIGSNREEAASYAELPFDLGADQARALVYSVVGPEIGAILVDVLYPFSDYPSPYRAVITALTDNLFTCPTRNVALSAALFSEDDNESEEEDDDGGGKVWRWLMTYSFDPRGAFHSIQFPFLWNNFGNYVPTPEEVALSDAMIAYWTNFAKRRNPNGQGLVFWPRYHSDTEKYLQLDLQIRVDAAYHVPQCDFFNLLPPLPL